MMRKARSLHKRLTQKQCDGFILPISETSWTKIDRKARNLIRNAQRRGVQVTIENLSICNTCKNRNRFGGQNYDFRLGNHRCYTAMHDNEAVGHVLCDFAEPLIIYRCACSMDVGKKLGANSLLIWNLITVFSGSAYRYFALGYSSIPSIQHFKEQFAVLRLLVPSRFWDFLPNMKEVVRGYVIFEKRTTDNP